MLFDPKGRTNEFKVENCCKFVGGKVFNLGTITQKSNVFLEKCFKVVMLFDPKSRTNEFKVDNCCKFVGGKVFNKSQISFQKSLNNLYQLLIYKLFPLKNFKSQS